MKTMKKHKSLSFLQIFKGRQKDNLCVSVCGHVYVCTCVHVPVKPRDQPQALFLRCCPCFFETEASTWI